MIKKASPKGDGTVAGSSVSTKLLGALLISLTMITGCSSEWDQESTNTITKACIRGCIDVNDPNPILFCECIVPKIKDKYKNVAEADSLIKKPVLIAEFGAECRVATNEAKADWNEQNSKAFLNSCEAMAKREGVAQAGYCDCIFEKVKRRYVTTTRMEGVNMQRLKAIGKECLDKK